MSILSLAEAAEPPEVVRAVAAALDGMVRVDGQDLDHDSVQFACQLLGKHPNPQWIPTLIRALDDNYVNPYCTDPNTHVVYYEAAWLDADEALRAVTKASPIAKPSRQVEPTEELRLKVRQAWWDWWKAQSRPATAPAKN